MSNVQVFVSFDLEHDLDLYDLLHAQATSVSSGFEIWSGVHDDSRAVMMAGAGAAGGPWGAP
jgi:hypothetical protein